MTPGDVALLVAAVAWALLAVALVLVLLNVYSLVSRVGAVVDGVRDETLPLLRELAETVSTVNKDLGHLDGVLSRAEEAAEHVRATAGVLRAAISNPVVKAMAYGAGAARAYARLKERKRR